MANPADIVRYPLMAYNFRVTVADKTMSFSEVSGLVRQHETLTYRHGLSAWEGERVAKYYYDKHAPITLKRGTFVNESVFLYAWLEAKQETSMTISLCNERGLPIVHWKVAKAIPVKLSAPAFDASASQVSIETLEVMAAGITLGADPQRFPVLPRAQRLPR